MIPYLFQGLESIRFLLIHDMLVLVEIYVYHNIINIITVAFFIIKYLFVTQRISWCRISVFTVAGATRHTSF